MAKGSSLLKICLISLYTLSLPLWAQNNLPAPKQESTPSPPLKLDLKSAIDLALKTNQVARASRQEVVTAYQRLRQKTSFLKPRLDFAEQIGRGKSMLMPDASLMPGPITMVGPGGETVQNFKLYARYPLWTGGRLQREVEVAEEQQQASSTTADTVSLDVTREVKTLYYRVLEGDALVQIAEAALRAAEERVRILRGFYEVGRSALYEVLQAEADAADWRRQVVEARNERNLRLVDLKVALGIDPSKEVILTEKLEKTPFPLTREEALQKALAQRPEILTLQHLRRSFEKMKAAVKGEYLPQVYLSVALDSRGPGTTLDFRNGLSWLITAGLPLFDGENRKARIQEAESERRKLDIEEERLRISISAEVEKAFLNLRTAEEAIKAAEAGLKQAEETYRIYQERYQVGRGILVEVLTAQQWLVKAQTNMATALANWNIAIAEVERAVGLR